MGVLAMQTHDRSHDAVDDGSESALPQSSTKTTILASLKLEEMGTTWSEPRARSVLSESSWESKEHAENGNARTYKLYWGSNFDSDHADTFRLYWGAHGHHVTAPSPY